MTRADAKARTLDVRLNRAQAARLAGEPTGEDGEQAFFSMLWRDGPYGPVSRHYMTKRIDAFSEDGVRVYAAEDFQHFEDIISGGWRVSVPVPGIAHRYGPGPCFRIHDNENVSLEDIELWAAPWFGFNVMRNTGTLTFRQVHVRPKPESGRAMSVWRDGFHVKGNRATLLWEDCMLEGMNDDAFNISTHSSAVTRLYAPTRVEVRQKYPLAHIPWRVGDTLVAADEAAGQLLGAAVVVAVEEEPAPAPINGPPAAPRTTLMLDKGIAELHIGTMVWAREAANPETTLRRCTIRQSSRMQSPMTLQACDVTGLLWFYAEHIEGPFPSGITVKDSVLRRGRGNPTHAVIFSGAPDEFPSEPSRPARAIHDVIFTGNTVWGGFVMRGVENARITDNAFLETGAPRLMEGNHALVLHDNHPPR